ncbi:hypothetical protein MNBD_GAMMA11-3400 [hydrothermal vent metagenome]|uniref:Nudix hydrolase domain-containing protein n=1 Tax=hydrothermal vent metagenome TaxID=652676 RepID=A0A3B0XBR0_9ZZZZ
MPVKEPVVAAVATLVFSENRLLLGKRVREQVFRGWQCPGGFLQRGESVEAAARRYCLEKAGVEIKEIRVGPYTNNIADDDPGGAPLMRHTATLYQIAQLQRVKNAEKFEDQTIVWSWFDLQALPVPQFLPLKLLLEQYNLRQLAGI